jgi:hypothetical protein
MTTVPTAADFRVALLRVIKRATTLGRAYVEINAGDMHRSVGGYPGPDHRMPMCCAAMRKLLIPGRDTIVSEPERGQGASLTIRYALPR